MAQHDVYQTKRGEFLLDCQSDFLSDYNTRFVVPLIDPNKAPKVANTLNPTFIISGKKMVMFTQFAASIPAEDLTEFVETLSHHRYEIINALDALIGA